MKAIPALPAFPFWTVYAAGAIDQAMDGDDLFEVIE